MSLNKVMLIGRLGKDVELKYTPSGQAVANFSLATSERFSGKDGQRQERTEWHTIVAWGKQAELANQYLAKGREVYIEGRIQTRSWDDRDGNKRYKTEVVANQILFLGSREGGGSAAAAGGEGYTAHDSVASQDSGAGPVSSPDAGSDIADDDLPF